MSLRQRLLRALLGLTAPVPTGDLIVLVGSQYKNPSRQVWWVLRKLEKQGFVERIKNIPNTSPRSRSNTATVTGWRATGKKLTAGGTHK